MPTPRKKIPVLDLKNNLEEKYVAFIDVMGFSELVNGNSTERLEDYFVKITDVLTELRNDKANIQSFLISDSIILIAPDSVKELKQLLTAVRRIQSSLISKKILLRGAVSFGPVYYNNEKNIIVGKGFIKAYNLEKEAVFPRVIIDPFIVRKMAGDKCEFIEIINGSLEYTFEDRIIYRHSDMTEINNDAIFIDYANRFIRKDKVYNTLTRAYDAIVDNLYGDQRLYTKYIWLKDYLLECLKLTKELLEKDAGSKTYLKTLSNWIEKFQRL